VRRFTGVLVVDLVIIESWVSRWWGWWLLRIEWLIVEVVVMMW
jgi:hypothetical protein